MVTAHYVTLHLASKLALEMPYSLLTLKKQAAMNPKVART